MPLTLHYVHDLFGNIIAEYTGDGVLNREYVWLDERPLAVVAHASAATNTYFVHTDHLERPVMMTTAGRAVIWNARYLPFGEVWSLTGSNVLDRRLPGQWFQMETGLAYNWHRTTTPPPAATCSPTRSACPTGRADGRMCRTAR